MLVSQVDWGAVGTIAGVGVALVGAIVHNTYQAGRAAQRMEDTAAEVDKNSRHLDSVMATVWPLIWRVTSIEDHLATNDEYKPPTLIPPIIDPEKGGR